MANNKYVAIAKEICSKTPMSGDEFIGIDSNLDKLKDLVEDVMLEHLAFHKPALNLPPHKTTWEESTDSYDNPMWVFVLMDLEEIEVYTAHIYPIE